MLDVLTSSHDTLVASADYFLTAQSRGGGFNVQKLSSNIMMLLQAIAGVIFFFKAVTSKDIKQGFQFAGAGIGLIILIEMVGPLVGAGRGFIGSFL